MKPTTRFVANTFLLVLASGVAAFGQTQPTPAEISIAKALEKIAQQHGSCHERHDSLAMAYARRARETSGRAYYEKAEETLNRAFELAPDDMEAAKVRTWLLLGRHEFGKALDAATKLNQESAGRRRGIWVSGGC